MFCRVNWCIVLLKNMIKTGNYFTLLQQMAFLLENLHVFILAFFYKKQLSVYHLMKKRSKPLGSLHFIDAEKICHFSLEAHVNRNEYLRTIEIKLVFFNKNNFRHSFITSDVSLQTECKLFYGQLWKANTDVFLHI